MRELFRKRLEFEVECSIKGDNLIFIVFKCVLKVPEWIQFETTVSAKYGFQRCLILTYI